MSATASERQPLLPPTVLLNDTEVHERRPLHDEEATTPQQPDAPVDEEVQGEVVLTKRLTRGQIIWRVFLWSLLAFFLGLFIKGFIDADDVKVRLSASNRLSGSLLISMQTV